MSLRINGSTSGYIELDAPAVAGAQTFVVPNDFGFASGTVMLFQQTASPTGWTKITTHNDKALRVVSGTVTTGGASTFSAVMNGSVDATTLTIAQIPSHGHSLSFNSVGSGGGDDPNTPRWSAKTATLFGAPGANANANGSSGSHTHSMNVAYVDVIFASKN